MSMPARISLVTLGVRDLRSMSEFYGRLGWRKSSVSNESVSFFDTGGAILGLYGRAALAKDARVDAGPPRTGHAFPSVAFAINVDEKEQVDAALAEARTAGARITKPAEDAFWGGRSGYFADPEGNLWEVAWNPGFPLDARGAITLPE